MGSYKDELFNILILNADWESEEHCWEVVTLIMQKFNVGLFLCEGCGEYKDDVIEFKDGFYCIDCSYGDH